MAGRLHALFQTNGVALLAGVAGKCLAAGQEDGTLELYDVEDGEVLARRRVHMQRVTAACWVREPLLRRVLTLLRRVLTLLRRVLTLLRRVLTLLRRVLTLLRRVLTPYSGVC